MLPKRCSKGNNNKLQTTGTAKMHGKSERSKFAFEIRTHTHTHEHSHTETDTHTSKRAHTDCQHRLKNKATVWRLFQLYM